MAKSCWLVRETTLSNNANKSNWQLNDFLLADKQKQSFSSVSWGTPNDAIQQDGFKLWAPTEIVAVEEPTEGFLDASGALKSDQKDQVKDAPIESEPEPEMFGIEVVRDAETKSFQEGYNKGYAEAEQKFTDAKNLFVQLTNSVEAAHRDPATFFAPLKQLSLSMAQQLVRGELSSSSVVIERLVTEALKDIEVQGNMPTVLSLNPMDMRLIEQHLVENQPQLVLREDPLLQRGSIKLTFDNASIEDLMENRLAELFDSMMTDIPISPSVASGELTSQVPVSDEIEGQYEQSLPEGEGLKDAVDKALAKQIDKANIIDQSAGDSTLGPNQEDDIFMDSEPAND